MRRRSSLFVVVALCWATLFYSAPALAGGCTITGTGGDDVLRGTAAKDIICGLGGDDIIKGLGGDDVLRGGGGQDELFGGPGIDSLLGAVGEDLLKGGLGDDILKGGPAPDVLNGGAGLDFCSPLDVLDVLTNCEDVTAPKLQSLSIAPAVVDTSSGPQTILVKAHITDDESGLSDGFDEVFNTSTRVFFVGPDGSQTHLYADFRPGETDPERNLVSGDRRDGYYEVPITLPQYSAQGRWKINYVSLEDEATNHRYIWSEDLAAAGLPTGFDQVGLGDSAPPQLSAFSFTPSEVDTSEGPAQIEVTAMVTDDVSGIQSAHVAFYRPGGRSFLNVLLQPSGGDVYSGTLEVPRYTQQGTWTIDQVALTDLAGNRGYLDSEALAERGFQNSFEQTGLGDEIPPQLIEFDFTPKQVDTRAEDQPITVTARITDDLSGVAEATVSFMSPSEECSSTCPEGMQFLTFRFLEPERISGGPNDGVYQLTVPLPRYSKLGTWTVRTISLVDSAHNERLLFERNDDPTFFGGRNGEVSALGFPVSFENGGSVLP